jgi:hypothetical protein
LIAFKLFGRHFRVRGDNMSARVIISKSSPWRKRIIFLAAFWVLSFGALLIVSTNNELSRPAVDAKGLALGLPPLRNEIKGLRYIHEENHRPIYAVSLGNLRAENNKLGIFKTGLHKVAKIQDLELALYRYPSSKIISNTKPDNKSSITTVATDRNESYATTVTDESTDAFPALVKFADGIHKLVSRRDGWRINIDLSNTSEVSVANFDCKVFYDGALLLNVRSKRATTSNKCPDEVILRGHVTISTGDGTALESNCAIWDIAKQRFTVDGTYFLTRNGKKIRGKDICVDDKLNIVQAQIAALKEKGKENG